MSTLAAFDLLVVLGTNSIDNLKLIDKYITDLFYTGKIKSFRHFLREILCLLIL